MCSSCTLSHTVPLPFIRSEHQRGRVKPDLPLGGTALVIELSDEEDVPAASQPAPAEPNLLHMI